MTSRSLISRKQQQPRQQRIRHSAKLFLLPVLLEVLKAQQIQRTVHGIRLPLLQVQGTRKATFGLTQITTKSVTCGKVRPPTLGYRSKTLQLLLPKLRQLVLRLRLMVRTRTTTKPPSLPVPITRMVTSGSTLTMDTSSMSGQEAISYPSKTELLPL